MITSTSIPLCINLFSLFISNYYFLKIIRFFFFLIIRLFKRFWGPQYYCHVSHFIIIVIFKLIFPFLVSVCIILLELIYFSFISFKLDYGRIFKICVLCSARNYNRMNDSFSTIFVLGFTFIVYKFHYKLQSLF